jgi:2-aminoethylphosphonate-pyruvate transaminase
MENGGGKWRFTSPTHVLNAFLQALVELDAEGGVAARFRRIRRTKRPLAEGMRRLGFHADTCAGAPVPGDHDLPLSASGLRLRDFYERVKARGLCALPGQGSPARRASAWRIGDIRPDDIREMLDAVASTGCSRRTDAVL